MSATLRRRIKHLVSIGAWHIDDHAFQRAAERGDLHVLDIEHALLRATHAAPQGHAPWIVYGPDLSGRELSLVAYVDDSALVVTVLS